MLVKPQEIIKFEIPDTNLLNNNRIFLTNKQRLRFPWKAIIHTIFDKEKHPKTIDDIDYKEYFTNGQITISSISIFSFHSNRKGEIKTKFLLTPANNYSTNSIINYNICFYKGENQFNEPTEEKESKEYRKKRDSIETALQKMYLDIHAETGRWHWFKIPSCLPKGYYFTSYGEKQVEALRSAELFGTVAQTREQLNIRGLLGSANFGGIRCAVGSTFTLNTATDSMSLTNPEQSDSIRVRQNLLQRLMLGAGNFDATFSYPLAFSSPNKSAYFLLLVVNRTNLDLPQIGKVTITPTLSNVSQLFCHIRVFDTGDLRLNVDVSSNFLVMDKTYRSLLSTFNNDTPFPYRDVYAFGTLSISLKIKEFELIGVGPIYAGQKEILAQPWQIGLRYTTNGIPLSKR